MATYNNNGVTIESPSGSIIAYLGGGNSGTNDPPGWLICDGRVISRTTYSKLFAVISTTYGVGNGSTTFSLPDLRGLFLRGAKRDASSAPGNYGDTLGTIQSDNIKSTTGTTYNADIVVGAVNGIPPGGGLVNTFATNDDGLSWDFTHSHTFTIGSGLETRPYNMSVNWIIKY
jgi:hypothetical protein